MPLWKQTAYKTDTTALRFGAGINTALPALEIGESEASYLRDVDAEQYPAVSVRQGRSVSSTAQSTAPWGLGQRNEAQIHTVYGNTWRYTSPGSSTWTDLTTGLANTTATYFGEFVTGSTRYTILLNGTQKKIWDGSSTATAFGDALTPASALFTVHSGRVYVLSGAQLAFSGLNLPNDFTTANDAGNITITNAKGPGTAVVTYGGTVVVWTAHSMHELHGTGPFNYNLVDIEGGVGCMSQSSVAICNGVLYWLGYDGIYAYSGGIPRRVSDKVKTYIDGIPVAYVSKVAAGVLGQHLYMSIPYGSSATANNLLLHLDTRYGTWFVETATFVSLVTIANSIYGVDKDGIIWKLRDGTVDGATAISWSFITKAFQERPIAAKRSLVDMYAVASFTTSSTFGVTYSTNIENTDTSSFRSLSTGVAGSSNTQEAHIPIPTSDLKDLNWYRLRFAGTGPATLHHVIKKVLVKR